jgi:hypothetical protein
VFLVVGTLLHCFIDYEASGRMTSEWAIGQNAGSAVSLFVNSQDIFRVQEPQTLPSM